MSRLGLRAATLAALLVASFWFPVAGESQAETKPMVSDGGVDKPKTFLFVGNSFMYYNNSMHKQFRVLAQAADPENKGDYRATSVTISGSGLSWHHMESYFRPDALAEFSFVAGNQLRFNEFDKLFDVVIMMDCSQCPIHPRLKDRFHEYVAKHGETVANHGARPMLLMTWAYEDEPAMTKALAEEYTVAGNTNEMLVIPAGLAFARARRRQPDLQLYEPDKRHPSLQGTYLSALTIYAAIYRKSPVGGPAPEGVDAEIAKLLQAVAWETVQDYYGTQ